MLDEKIIASARIRHNGEWLKPGDEIVGATEQDKLDLVAMGMATRLSGMTQVLSAVLDTVTKPRPRRAQYERRDMKAEPSTTTEEEV